MSDEIKKSCYNCKYFKFGQLRKTFAGQELYYRGKCQAPDGDNINTLSIAGEKCGLYKQAEDAKVNPHQKTMQLFKEKLGIKN